MSQDSYKEPSLLLLGRAVQQMRERRGMRVDDLAAASGVDRERISELETGQLDPTYELLLKIADGLGTQPSALVVLAEQLDASPEP